jgi:hypothetical protein
MTTVRLTRAPEKAMFNEKTRREEGGGRSLVREAVVVEGC